jgi:hypothetical protein
MKHLIISAILSLAPYLAHSQNVAGSYAEANADDPTYAGAFNFRDGEDETVEYDLSPRKPPQLPKVKLYKKISSYEIL